MNSRLEQYVEEATARLKSLPELEREQEIREMRQHLDDLVAAHRELGEDEASATNAALAQFDAARNVATDLNVVNRYRRGKVLPEDMVTVLFTLAVSSVAIVVFSLVFALLVGVSPLSTKLPLGSLPSCRLPLGLLALEVILFREGWRGALSRFKRDTATGAATHFILLCSVSTWVLTFFSGRFVLPAFGPLVLHFVIVLIAGLLTARCTPRHAVRGVQIAAFTLNAVLCLDTLLMFLHFPGTGTNYVEMLLRNLMTDGVLAALYIAFALLGATLGTRGAGRQQYTNKA